MKEYSVFISYRKIDGQNLASWIFEKIQGKSHVIDASMVVSTSQMDLAIPGGSDWKTYIESELKNANSLIIVCSPATMYEERDKDDWFYHEIKWWVKYKKNNPPILVATNRHGIRYIPYLIKDCWPNLQVTEICEQYIQDEHNGEAKRLTSIFMQSIYRGIMKPSSNLILKSENSPQSNLVTNIPGVFTWAKDRYHRYLEVNENYARAAGYDSPKAMLGKTDFKMPWRSLALMFQKGDFEVMEGNELSRIGIYEKEIMVDRVADILVHECAIKDHSGRIIGVQGCFFDISGNLPTHKMDIDYKFDENGLCLGKEFENLYLDAAEILVFQLLVRNTPRGKIALQINRSVSYVSSIIALLKKKFQCLREEDIVATAVKAGLPLKLFSSIT